MSDILEPGYIGLTPEGREYVIVDMTPEYYVVEYTDTHAVEEIFR